LILLLFNDVVLAAEILEHQVRGDDDHEWGWVDDL